MKKTAVILVAALLTIGIVSFGWGKVKATFRYDTPELSYEKSGPWFTELNGVLTSGDFSMVVYTDKSGAFFTPVLHRDDRGWTPVSHQFDATKRIYPDAGIVYLRPIDDKFVIDYRLIVPISDPSPVVSDTLGTSFLSKEFESGEGKLICGIAVLDMDVPTDYQFLIDGKAFSFEAVGGK